MKQYCAFESNFRPLTEVMSVFLPLLYLYSYKLSSEQLKNKHWKNTVAFGKNNKCVGALVCASFHVATYSTYSGEALISFGIPTVLPACRYHYSTWVAPGVIITTQHGVSYLIWPQSRLGFFHLSLCTFSLYKFLSLSVLLLKNIFTYCEIGNRIEWNHLFIPQEATVFVKAFHCIPWQSRERICINGVPFRCSFFKVLNPVKPFADSLTSI